MPSLSSFGIIALALAPYGYAGTPCQASLDTLGGLTVREVRIETPLALPSDTANRLFLSSLGQRLASLKSLLAIQAGQKFNRAAYDAGQFTIAEHLIQQRSRERVRLGIVVPTVRDCSSDSLTVVYRIYTTDAPYYLTHLFEFNATGITQALAPALTGSAMSHLIAPIVGYNASRGVFGGARVGIDTGAGLFQKLNLGLSGSARSLATELGSSGQHDYGRSVLDHAEWQFDYRFRNEPVAESPIRLRSQTFAGQVLGSTRAVPRSALVFRYGAAIESGSRQGDVSPAPGLDPTSYGSIKASVGSTFGLTGTQGSASYGLQLGKASASFSTAYVKHLLDVRFRQRFLPRAHVPVHFDSAFNAGWIQSPANQIPTIERFYGGNAAREFLGGNSWSIQDGPRLRSFPQYAFNRVSPDRHFGATRFVSANFTFAPTVRYYPAVPDDILSDPVLRSALSLELSTTKEAFVNDCAARTRPFEEVVSHIRAMDPVLREASAWQAHLHALPLPERLSPLLSDAEDTLRTLQDATAGVILHRKSGASVPQARNLASDDEERSQILQLAVATEALADGLMDTPLSSEVVRLQSSARMLRNASSLLQSAFARVQALNQPNPASYQSVVDLLPPMRAALDAVRAPLNALTDIQDASAVVYRDAALTYLDDAIRKLKPAESPNKPADLADNLDTLLLDWGKVAPSSPRSLGDTLALLQGALLKAGMPRRAKTLDAPLGQLEAALRQITARLRAVRRPPTQSCAFADAGFAVRAADAAFRELNLFHVSPVWIFDVARLSSTEGSTGPRYGTGPGFRFSLATLNLSGGYAFNVGRKAGESRGAFFFTLDVTDLFR